MSRTALQFLRRFSNRFSLLCSCLAVLIVCVCVCDLFGGQYTGYGVLQVCCVLLHSTACTSVLRVLSDWTLGAAAYPSKKLAMSVRRHTKVLADGEG